MHTNTHLDKTHLLVYKEEKVWELVEADDYREIIAENYDK